MVSGNPKYDYITMELEVTLSGQPNDQNKQKTDPWPSDKDVNHCHGHLKT